MANKQRVKFCYVLIRDGDIKLAYVYLFYLIKHKEEDIFGSQHMFWDLLKNFWPGEKVIAWQAQLFPEGINEIVIKIASNLITLCPKICNLGPRFICQFPRIRGKGHFGRTKTEQ